MTMHGVGARLPRKEDDRYLRGRGQYIGDIQLAGVREIAFVRSPVAHARIGAIEIPDGGRGRVFTAADLAGVKAMLAVSGLPGFKASAQSVLATGKVRHVGELVAMCIGRNRAEAEDLAESVRVEFEELPVVVDMLDGRRPGAPLVHDEWGDNIFLRSELAVGDMAATARTAPVTVRTEIRTQRQCISPMEGRGVVAQWDYRLGQLLIHSSTQVPHLVRTGLAECLGLDEGSVRVVAPDVGGGFGYKCFLLPEEVCLGWLARRLGRPVRWLEDRREQLTAGANCREHHYHVTAYATKEGRILGLDFEATVDSGAYSVYPFTACLEAGQLPSMLPGPYDFPVYRGVTYAVASNKVPITPYRGVARPCACLALETIVDAVARAVGREPYAVRLDNLVRPEQMPFDNIAGKHFDGGDYPDCLRRAAEAIGLDAIRERQRRGESDGRRVGVGFAFFNEQGAVGTTVYSKWGIPMVPGHEQASVRLTPDGVLELKVGIQSHGQGLETTLAQVAHEVLGIDPARVKVVHGDTALTPYSIGTWGSRSMVMAGGAVAQACRELAKRIARIGAYCLEVEPGAVSVGSGEVRAGDNRISIDDVARIWYRRPQDLPKDVDSGGLELTVGYKPRRDSGTFSYSAHAVVVVVDLETGHVELEKYVVVEDGGTLVNPMIVEGQVYGGVAQGIGTALHEEMLFSEDGQPLASTLADYILPGAGEVPAIEIIHTSNPSPNTEFGVKGIGEGGAIGPPAAIVNGINDALRPLGVEVSDLPVTPRRLLAAIAGARAGGGSR
jgi:carbon-monoxide dehydrogenase large subunit